MAPTVRTVHAAATMVDRATAATADLSPVVHEAEEHLPTVEVLALAAELVHQHREALKYGFPGSNHCLLLCLDLC